ncbi:cupin-like domain-containing protein [Sphingomonas sp.]|uniref:cupin-like domain-containing protein n=1 Tax=Sphingomonas sp. TaxID=28214 RepID=UPI0038A64DC7
MDRDRPVAVAPLPEWRASDRISPSEILECRQPVVLRALVDDWPAVACARRGATEIAAYLEHFDRGTPIELFVGEAAIDGRYFYNDDVSGFNFQRASAAFPQFIAALLSEQSGPGGRSVYAGSQPVRALLSGFENENPLPLMASRRTEPRIWIGNRSRVAPHFDEADNLACVVAGTRRFTIFPPDQVANLYIGPLDFTMAGQQASMVDLARPDLERFPRFAEALSHAFTAELEPGDAIFIPALWWHGVEAPGGLNVLINYWWQDVAPDLTSAFASMAHASTAIRELPSETREAWRSYFDYFVFQRDGDPAAHLPLGRRGILGTPSPDLRRRIRQFLLRVLSSG